MSGETAVVKSAQNIPRSLEISEEEKQAARMSLEALQAFMKKLGEAQQHDERLSNVLKRVPEAVPDQMYEIRHLLHQFQSEVRSNYRNLIPEFGKALDLMSPLLKDTETAEIKNSLVDTMQRISDAVETYMEELDAFSPEQVQNLTMLAGKIAQLVNSMETLVDVQLREHFNKNVLRRRKSIAEIRLGIMKRARLIRLFGGNDGDH